MESLILVNPYILIILGLLIFILGIYEGAKLTKIFSNNSK